MATVSRFGFRIPEQVPPKGSAFFLSAKEVKTWANRLPVANVGETSRQVFKALVEFNRSLVAGKSRLLSIEGFRGPVNYISENLARHFIDAGLPLSDKSHKIAILSRELANELATAYKCVVEDLLRDSPEKVDRKLLAISIHRGINYLSGVLLQSALIYDTYPHHTWKELHTLHRLAQKYKVNSLAVRDDMEQHIKTSTIDGVYRRILLYSLASPYKMRQRDNLTVFRNLQEWSHFTKLYSQQEAPPEAVFAVQQDSDYPPSHESLAGQANEKHRLRLDTRELIDKLREQFDDTSVPAKEGAPLVGAEQLNKNLLRQLIQLWTTVPQREFVRTKLNFELRVAVGLSDIYHLTKSPGTPLESNTEARLQEDVDWMGQQTIRGERNENRLDADSSFTLIPIEPSNDIRRSGFEEFGPGSRDESEPEPAVPIWGNGRDNDSSAQTHTFRTLNESAGGYCIAWQGARTPAIKVGELIGIQSASANGQFGVGIVRWIRNTQKNSLQVGLQMIAPNAVAVEARRENLPNAQAHECLLLPEVGTSGQPASFIGPSYPFKVGNKMKLDDGSNKRKIKLKRVLETTGTISQFQFSYLDQVDQSAEESSDEDSDFDNIWSII